MNPAHTLANNIPLLPKQRTGGSMLFDPTERNVDPFLFPTRNCSMKELILALAIHDKNVTMAKSAKVAFIARTGLTPPSEDCGAAKSYGNNELGSPHFPNKGSSSHCQPTHEFHPGNGSGSRRLATLPQHTMASSGVR